MPKVAPRMLFNTTQAIRERESRNRRAFRLPPRIGGPRLFALRLLLIAALSALLLVACSDDDGGSATPSPTSTSSTASTPTAEPTSSVTATATAIATSSPVPTGAAGIEFERHGNLMRDNPGFPPGVWVLSYEQPGAPALSAQLEFDDASECTDHDHRVIDCAALEVGMRVEVKGLDLGDGVVRVLRLEVDDSQ